MTLQASGIIKLSEVADEYLAPFKVPFSEMIRGGEFVYNSGAGYPNENVAETPPVKLTQFYSGDRNPNPVQAIDQLVSATIVGSRALPLGATSEGLFVEAHDNSGVVAADAQFAIRMKMKKGVGYVAEDRSFNIPSGDYQQANLQLAAVIGVTLANPFFSSIQTIFNNMVGIQIEWYQSGKVYGFARLQGHNLGSGDVDIYEGGSGDPHYTNEIQPVFAADSVEVQVRRNNPDTGNNNKARWDVLLYDRTGSTFWQSHSISGGESSTAGWLVVANINWSTGKADLSIDWVKAVAGGVALP